MKNQTRYRNLILLTSQLIWFGMAQAHPTFVLTTLVHPIDSVRIKSAPQKTKATESPFYIKLYGLYGLVTPSPQIDHIDSDDGTTGATMYKTYKTKLGLGPRAGIGIGAVVSDFINIGLDADILLNKTPSTHITIISTDANKYVSNLTIFSKLKLISISPNITFKALSRPSYYIYNRLGVVGGLVLSYQTMTHVKIDFLGSPFETENLTDYTKNSLSIGYQAALGIQFRLFQKLRGFAEAVLYNQTFKPQESQTGGSRTVISDAGKYSDLSQSGPPHGQPSFNVTVNSLSFGVGLVFRP